MVAPSLLAHPVTAEVDRGGSSDLELEAVPSYGSEVKFLITKNPLHGSLGKIERISQNKVSVSYTNDGSKSSTDEFVFRFNAPGKSWATSRALLTIADPESSLSIIPSTLDFGTIAMGDRQAKEVILTNRLSSQVDGTLIVPSPWKLNCDGKFSLKLGESLAFKITYEPHEVDQSIATVSLFASAKTPKITLRGNSVLPFTVTPKSASITPDVSGAKFLLEGHGAHPLTVNVSAEDLLIPVPPILLKPGIAQKVILRTQKLPFKETNIPVIFSCGDFKSEVSLKIFPSQSPHTNTSQVSKKLQANSTEVENDLRQPSDLDEKNPNRTPSHRDVTNLHSSDYSAVESLGNIPENLGPSLFPENEQIKIRRLLVHEISYFLKPGWFAWRLSLQWHYDFPPPKEFLIEERLPVSSQSWFQTRCDSMEFKRVRQRHLKNTGDAVWTASIPCPPEGFQLIRIAPLLEGTNQVVWATFQVQIPPNKFIFEKYRWPCILLIISVIILFIVKIKRNI